MEKQDIFWDGFSKLKDKLMDIDALEDNKADEILQNLDDLLKNYCLGVDFILGDLTSEGRVLTFTANGAEEYFDDIIALSEAAPVMDFWTVQAFLPTMGKNQEYQYEDIVLRSKDLYFLPLESDSVKDKVGLKLAIKDKKITDDLLTCAYLLCEKMIGEYNATRLIDYFDIFTFEGYKLSKDYLPLDYLPDFIQWKIDSVQAQ